MVDSTEFSQVLAEAEDIAKGAGQKYTTVHLLLGMFTTENSGQALLRDRGIDEDRLLDALTEAPREQDGLLRELCDRARDIARSCNSPETECLHVLIAMTRVRCGAQDLMSAVGLELGALRNMALSYYLSGRMPRKLQPTRPPVAPAGRVPQRPLGAPPSALPSPLPAQAHAVAATAPRPVLPTSLLNLRDLADPDDAELPATAPSPSPLPEVARTLLPAAEPQRAPTPAPARNAASLDAGAFPLLTALGRNLSEAVRNGQVDPVVGRERELEEVIDVLGKRRTNNPCLVGEPGVGKTAVVEGVAHRLAQLKGSLGEKIIVELDVASLVAGTQLRGSFSEKLNALKDEVRSANGRVVVFIDEIHTLVGAGATGEGPQDAANELKSAMARGEFPCIGATTHEEFRKFIQQDPALERRFTSITVNEPSVAETVDILAGVITRYEEHHQLSYAPAALQAAAALSARYVTDRFLPDKAVSVVDLAGSRAHREGRNVVGAEDVARVVAKLAGVPEERLLVDDSARLLKLEDELSARIIGHEDAVGRIARVIRRNYAGFASRRPMGSFLFLGPTGVGKTEMARALADVLFGSRDALVRIDMSELSEPHSASRLLGSPAGYVGYGDGGQLTEAVRRRPSSVVVLDEIEKAHRDVLMLLLQVLEEGRLTDGKGRHIDFSNTVVVLTTNLGAEAFDRKARPMGFGSGDDVAGASAATDGAQEAARKALPPELWNRIDERLAFRPLREVEVARIANLLLAESSSRLRAEKGIAYVADGGVVEVLLRSGGFDPQLGARPMRQAVQRMVEAPLAERILAGEFGRGDTVRIAVEGAGQLAFTREARS